MAVALGPSKRFVILLVLASTTLVYFFISHFRSQPIGTRTPGASSYVPAHHINIDSNTLTGHAIMPKLGNETAKAELGRAAWKLFHTTFARFPDKPTPEESNALQAYIYLFQRLYPCGECAEHFRHILDSFPPQVSSRSTAAAWGCHVHNEVNKSLNKDIFDCSNIGDFYDCGCADDPETEAVSAARKVPDLSDEAKEKMKGTSGRSLDEEQDTALPKLEMEGWGRGG